MAYEHAQEAAKVAGNLLTIMDQLTDAVPDEQQIALLLAEASASFALVSSTLATESKQAFKAKFVAKVGLNFASRALDKFLPDSES